MASWTDYLNPINDLKAIDQYFFKGPANQQKSALDQASQNVGTDTQNIMNYYAGQQAQARQTYKPLQDMFSRAYGSGLNAPQMPKGNLGSMYGGG